MAQATDESSTRIVAREGGGEVLRVNFACTGGDKPLTAHPPYGRTIIPPG